MTSWQAPDHGEPYDPNPVAGPALGPPPGYLPGAGYPPGPYGPSYSSVPPGYAPYGYPAGDPRPGAATASAVLGFVLSGLLVLAGLVLFLGGAIASDVEASFGSGTHIGLELALDGIGDLVAAGLLIAGGVSMLGRGPAGRALLSAGAGIVGLDAVYWTVRFTDIRTDSWLVAAGLFVVLAVLAVCFAWTAPVTRWLRAQGHRTP